MKYLLKFLLHVSIFITLLISSTVSKKKTTKNKEPTLEEFNRLTGITCYTADLKRVFVCNNYLFYNETKAVLYHIKIYNDFKKIKSKSKPDGAFTNKIKTIKNKYIIGEYRGGDFYEINPFVEKYREEVWGDCGDCYRQITYPNFKVRVLEEINCYRKLHGVPIVSYDSKYNKYAKEEVKKFLKTRKSSSCDKQTKFGCVYMALPDSQAHLVISTLYEKLLAYYDWRKNVYKSKLDPAIQLIWKEVKYIGIDFTQKDYYLHIFLTFSSKVKNDKSYDKNVLPVKSTYIKKYGELPKKRKSSITLY
ncbi:CAP domain-containing protein [Strongyloides ratti]|uniref:CAP domain-containing protein n=1 Tax=Strongyloides ratti TaxID=34506 RepID=A0A090KWE4_STRRB|nr:CAP domain-containing protein [Strongyloides ratti]CEF61706.1 CAP domain-containing protein [Strongyloides ratti]